MTFTTAEKTKILRLKSELTSQFSVRMSAISGAEFHSAVREECIITGGSIASCFHNEKINDFDLYAKTPSALANIKTIILESMQSHIKEMKRYDLTNLDGSTPKAKLMITDNAVTLNGDIQFIYLSEAEACRQKFDFIHCMPWFDIRTQKLYISKDQYDAIANKHLLINPYGENIKFRRVDKYIKRGWAIKQDIYDNLKKEI